MKCSNDHRNLGQFLLDHRYSIQPIPTIDNQLYPYEELIINAHENQQESVHRHAIELLKYQGYVHLIDPLKQWSIPKFPLDTWDLQQNGLICRGHFSRLLRRLKDQWKSSQFRMNKEDLIEYGFQSGLFYI